MDTIIYRALCTVVLLVVFVANCAMATYEHDNGLRYGGQFLGTCNGDGMYFNDDSSYVMCSHSIAYIMPCAPGTRNSGRQLQTLQPNDDLDFAAFCDVNLVDIGYAAFHSQQGNGGSKGGSYGAPAPRGGSSSGGYSGGHSNQGYARQGKSYGTAKVVTYKTNVKSSYPKKPTYTPVYSQQQKGYSAPSYRNPKPKPNPGYGQIMTYGGNNNKMTSFVRRPTYQYQVPKVQNTRKYQ